MLSKRRVFNGKTVSDAVNKGLAELGVSEKDVKITVLEQPTKALLGLFGGKEAKVELEWHEPSPQPSASAPAEAEPASQSAAAMSGDIVEDARAYLSEIVARMGVQATIERVADDDGNVLFQMRGKDLGVLIGRRGQTLDALQTLINVFANRSSGEHVRIVLDAERFRERRKKTLEDLSLRLANQVVRTKKDVVLEPMSSLERRIIHFQLQNHPKVKTFSKGEEPNRRIVITLKS
ncbi:RNA-binding cell elongation regulator Jag/EloR [Paenibacillus sp.]|uniref:RNA-binding cell elongation regulator Jag/EloR n=1 Tax=Paenibacillus sp. TaxID=58172 RepID=UPI002D37596B|nr:RNA-binding cell elongation regulator Jag/EloR [Paenibacillus sp.]HZG57277.1 RNA-binding cell elongation regulator Jag/EloR [Paenibacillus sp.]